MFTLRLLTEGVFCFCFSFIFLLNKTCSVTSEASGGGGRTKLFVCQLMVGLYLRNQGIPSMISNDSSGKTSSCSHNDRSLR